MCMISKSFLKKKIIFECSTFSKISFLIHNYSGRVEKFTNVNNIIYATKYREGFDDFYFLRNIQTSKLANRKTQDNFLVRTT